MALTGTVTHVENSFENESSENIPGAVLYNPQRLTPAQQAQALANIGAVSVNESKKFVTEFTFNEETGSFDFSMNDITQNFKLPLFDSVKNIDLVDGKIKVEFNDSSLNKVIELPANSSAIIINDIVPDEKGHVRIGISDILDLTEELKSRVTNTDLNILRGLKVVSDEARKTLTIKDSEDIKLHTFSVDWLANSNLIKTPKSEVFRISQEHLDSENVVLELKELPSENEFIFTFCNGVLLNPNGIRISDRFLVIDKKTIEYEFRAGMKITVNYKH